MRYKIGLIFIILLSLGLNLCGINWGIPTKDRIKLIFNNSCMCLAKLYFYFLHKFFCIIILFFILFYKGL
jgi:hypothetical protein